MLVSSDETVVLSTVGWVDHGGFLSWDPESGSTRAVPVDDSPFLNLLPGVDDYFAVVHHGRAGGYSVSARHLSEVSDEIARLTIRDDQAESEGNLEVWGRLPQFYGGWDPSGPDGGRFPYSVVRIDAVSRYREVQRMEWLTGPAYDLGYQQMMTPLGLPAGLTVLIPVQRSSRPVIYDWDNHQVAGHLNLSERLGNPTLRFRSEHELWADDYDTLLRVNPSDWAKRDERNLGGSKDRSGGFIGEWMFNRDRSLCVVGRPFSGDVIGLACDSFEITHRAALGRQPLDVAVLSDGRVFARDWKTGDPLSGRLENLDA